ncbi:MAG TPA: bifunctional phosphoglucose/phosphomannose isomerase [Fimbriimonadaceae bacterium]|nr:bifunctional phosphoglucose/phosphomannose isomerase [Fimbriimonadaceae bacterium]
MHQLDNLEFVTRLDPKGMFRLTCDFPEQCRRALEISLAADLNLGGKEFSGAMLTGLGGSAAGGDFTRALFDAQGKIPFTVNRDYHLPSWVNSSILVFCASYSGNTEETISAYHDAKNAGCTVIAITSGGKLAEMARQDGFPVIQIPGGQPPRTALGYMLVPTIVACEQLGLLPAQPWEQAIAVLDKAAAHWATAKFEENETKQLAEFLFGNLSVIYGLGSWQSLVANRWKGQINENAKNMTFSAAFPELNHNEILGWVKSDEQGVSRWVGMLLEDGTESAKMNERFRVTEDLIKGVCEFRRVTVHGASLLEKMLVMALLGDFISLYLAALNGVDPENIDSINILKTALSKVS